MKTQGSLLAGFSLLVAFLGVVSASAQNYRIDWFTIDGGGGTSSGGQYTLSGTIGQPDAGELKGGNYVLDGGFWGELFMQIVPPRLYIERSVDQVTISWNPNTPGFYLRESPTIGPPSWSNTASGSSNPAVLPAAGPSRFFQLSNQ
ncbi:MAG TPA: hypothetical protein VKM56_01570 [Verrucomicrobiae bacterium]|nr:hypothetical protein [Verrucomicrobiae bacterium]